MPWHSLTLTAAAMLTGALALSRFAGDVTETSLERRQEVARLRAHFDSVDVELRQANETRLTPAQRRSRATLIGWLRDYREAGGFPTNDRFNVATPFFRDSRGVLCAMAYLIDRSGRSDIVDRVALSRNNAFIPELAGDSELRAWLDSTGLSVAEAARIQPGYGPIDDVPDDQEVSGNYALTSILVSGASLTTVGLNLIAPNRATAWAGVIAGSTAIVAGAVNLDGPGRTDDVAAANLIVGGAGVALGLYRLLSPPAALSQRQSAVSSSHLSVSPVVIAAAGSPRLGLAFHTRF